MKQLPNTGLTGELEFKALRAVGFSIQEIKTGYPDQYNKFAGDISDDGQYTDQEDHSQVEYNPPVPTCYGGI